MMQKTFSKASIFLFLCTFFLFNCGGERGKSGQFSQKLRTFLKDDQGISAEECAELQDLVAQDPKLESKYGSGAALSSHINEVAEKMSNDRRMKINYPIDIACGDDASAASKEASAFNFYIENSGSMYGYMGDNTAFDDVVLGLMTRINRYDEEINMAFVNDQIHPVKEKFDDFMDYLNPASLRSLGNTRSSNLADVVKIVIEQQADDDKAVILLSDFIFSISDHKNVRSELTDQKYGITNIVHNNRLKERGLGFLILKFQSQFDGNYFTFDNKRVPLDIQRPYYVWVIAPEATIKNFVERYEVERLKDFQESLVVYSTEDLKAPYYSILKSTDAKGRFNQVDRGTNKPIKAIKDIGYSSRGGKVFQFALAFDASDIPVGEDYLKNPDNYEVISDMDDNFTVLDVLPANNRNVSANDRGYKGSATHYLILESEEIAPGKQQLEVHLLKKLPEWVANSSTIDDRNIGDTNEDINKTFGFLELIEGVAGDFKPKGSKKDKYFTLTIDLER